MLSEHTVMAQIPVADMSRARRFYTDTLNLKPAMEMPEGLILECGDNTGIALYETPSAGKAAHTLASWKVDDLMMEMEDLKAKGVTFEEYDMPGLKTENGVATSDEGKAAWFKDSEGNILCINEM